MTTTREATGKAGRKARKLDAQQLSKDIEKDVLEGILENLVP